MLVCHGENKKSIGIYYQLFLLILKIFNFPFIAKDQIVFNFRFPWGNCLKRVNETIAYKFSAHFLIVNFFSGIYIELLIKFLESWPKIPSKSFFFLIFKIFLVTFFELSNAPSLCFLIFPIDIINFFRLLIGISCHHRLLSIIICLMCSYSPVPKRRSLIFKHNVPDDWKLKCIEKKLKFLEILGLFLNSLQKITY